MKTAREVYKDFNGKLVGTSCMRRCVYQTLVKMPDEIVDFVTKNCWFLGSMKNAFAYTFTGNDLKNQHLIFLSDELLNQDLEQIQFSIAHEIGHVILRHRNSTLTEQTKQEIRKQEKEADEFARKFI
jgi:hypothetical protein